MNQRLTQNNGQAPLFSVRVYAIVKTLHWEMPGAQALLPLKKEASQ
jgi:hypothetical protein